MFDINTLLRENIRNLKPYSSARDEYTGAEAVFLDANENPFNAPYNRYPDPYQREVKEKISKIKNVDAGQIFLGNGSDEPIDLLIRAFCEPGQDNIVTIDPTYGMYQVAADINNIEVVKVLLNDDFSLNTESVLDACTEKTKMVFVCSPNNPTGNVLNEDAMVQLANNFNGIVVVDEAYIDFAPEKSLLPRLNEFPNVVILQTFSKAWGMAGIRLGMALASPEIATVLSKIKYPYNINILTQEKALELLEREDEKVDWVKTLISEKEKLISKLETLPFVSGIYPSDANFLLVKVHDPKGIYDFLVEEKVIVRDRSKVALCEGCLRITIGSPEENKVLLESLNSLI